MIGSWDHRYLPACEAGAPDEASARERASEWLELEAEHVQMALALTDHYAHLEGCHEFSFQSAEYVRTGAFEAALIGQGPVFVHAATGVTAMVGGSGDFVAHGSASLAQRFSKYIDEGYFR